MTTATDTQLAPLAPLARVIADAVQETPIRVGSPEGAVDLIQQLIIRVAAYVGSELPATPGLDQKHRDGTGLAGDQLRAENAREVCQAMARRGETTWRGVLAEEIAEAFAETDPVLLHTELIQCAAVSQAWLHDLDTRPAA